ncbi:MAG: hypothetical protein DRI65_06730, partial [Chloroflexota bacterium]
GLFSRITPAPPDSRLRWAAWVIGSSKQNPAAGELIRYALISSGLYVWSEFSVWLWNGILFRLHYIFLGLYPENDNLINSKATMLYFIPG